MSKIFVDLNFGDIVIGAFLTIYLLEHGAVELNPLMNIFIEHSPVYFLLVKYFLTCSGMIWLLIHKNYYPLRGR
jgi:hypothetical protein